MSIRAILFDLDGTLLPMDQEAFVRAYIGGLARAAAGQGYDPRAMADAIMSGTAAMYKNDGSVTNEQAFWNAAVAILGDRILADRRIFDEFYEAAFEGVRATCGYQPRSREIIDLVRGRGLRTALATNPLFPAVATHARIRWAGLATSDFEIITTYENSRFCKPSLEYYRDVLDEMHLSPEECVMVGNDAVEDMAAAALGMRVFLLTDGILNGGRVDISAYPHGGIDDLIAFINQL